MDIIRKYQRDFYMASKKCDFYNMKRIWYVAGQYININHYNIDDNEFTALHFACSYECPREDLIEFLINCGADVNFCDSYGNTPIFYLYERGSLASIRLLIEKGVILDHKNNRGNTLMHIIVMHGPIRKDILSTIIQASASIDIKNNKGKSVLDKVDTEELKNFIINERENFECMQIKTPE